jgi:hypothetical protein
LTPVISSALRILSDDTSTVENNPQKAIVLLTAFYLFTVYMASVMLSNMGQLLGNKAGYKNKGSRAALLWIFEIA